MSQANAMTVQLKDKAAKLASLDAEKGELDGKAKE